jgi:general secretion pathway protein K
MRRAPRALQRGVALVIVIWVSLLLLVVASTFIVERRTEAMVVRNSVSLARAEAAADAGVQRGIFEMYRNDTSADKWARDGTPHDWTFDGIPVRVELRDESAKIDINTAADPLIRGLLVNAGLSDEDAGKVLDAILDWRDADSLKRPNGAEEADYQAAGLTYKPANAPFQAIEELQLVLGMRPDIYRRLAPNITVFSRQPGINPALASRDVLMAIPGITAEIVDAYIASREAAQKQNQAVPTLPQAAPFTSGNTMVATVRSEARLDDGAIFTREAVALLRPVPRKPVTFVAWRESTAAPEAAAGDAQQAGGAQPPPAPPAPATLQQPAAGVR